MKRHTMRYILALAAIGLLFVEGIRATTSHAQVVELEPFILRFVEIAPANATNPRDSQRTSLVFVIREDGTTLLAVDRIVPERSDDYMRNTDIIWQQTGTLTADQLNQVIAAQKLLHGVGDQFWSGKDYAFDFAADGVSPDMKRVLLSPRLQHANPTTVAALQKIVHMLLDLRKASEPLVVFDWGGGFAARSTLLTIWPDGQLTYEDLLSKTTAKGAVPQQDMNLIRQLVRNADYLAYSSVVASACADCWTYSVVSITQAGLKTTEFDESALEQAPQSLKSLVTLLSDLSDKAAQSAATITPTASPTAIPPTATSTLAPGTAGQTGARSGRTSVQYGSPLNPANPTIDLGVLDTPSDILIGAARRFQLQPSQVPTDCTVFVLRGPMAYAIGLFGPGWMEEGHDLTEATINAHVQDGIDYLSTICDRDKIKVLRVP